MNWILAAPFFIKHDSGLWATVSKMDNTSKFVFSPPTYDHSSPRKQSGVRDWLHYWQHSADAWQKAMENNSGIITSFPQLPTCVGLRKRLLRKDLPVIAWTFNLGHLHGNVKRVLAQYALNRINKFIVHSSAERVTYSQYLNLPENRFEFIPLHKALFPITEPEEQEHPFILSMGSAKRDYATLFRAIKKLALPLTVVAPQYSLSGLDIPPTVTLKSNLSLSECRKLVQQARISIIPIDNDVTASGQVTILDAMVYARPIIATNTIGSRDYIVSGSTGILTSPRNTDELESAIYMLWNNEQLRKNIARQAYQYISTELTEKRTSERIIKILRDFN